MLLTTVSEITGYLFQCGSGEDVVIVNAKRFPQLLAQICQLLQTLLNHLFSLRDILGNSSFMFPDARRTLRLIEVHLRQVKCRFDFNIFFFCQYLTTQ